MSTRCVPAPTSRVRFGMARVDITPPVGIYHRLWGAARHDRATGVHRPLYCDVMAFAPVDGSARPFLRAQLDLCGLVTEQHEDVARALCEAADVPRENVVITFSHTHSSGWFIPDRFELPGGELILPYLHSLPPKLKEACQRALANLQEVNITYATGRCNMAANRDYWDDQFGAHTCGYNPDAPFDDTVLVARVTDLSGRLVATMVNYSAHPTTLAWENSLISPDFVGGMREVVEANTGVRCVFLQAPCGDTAPRDDYVGGTEVADKNGRQLGYAALSALESMGPPATDFVYEGPVISGATLGVWRHVPFSAERLAQASRFFGGAHTVELPLKQRPDPVALQAEFDDWVAKQREADARGEAIAARDYGARAERARRWLAVLKDLPEGKTYTAHFTVHRLGDAFWVTSGGEPYSLVQRELRARFPQFASVVSPLSGDFQVAYMLPRELYGQGLYQEEPSILGPGCLETLIEAMAAQVAALEQ
mgnify:CR=1 FL=1